MLVRSFNWSLSHTQAFPCFLRGDAVILNKLHAFSTTMHALLWPTFTALLSALLLLLSWRLTGCRVWRESQSFACLPTLNPTPSTATTTNTTITTTAIHASNPASTPSAIIILYL
ncbi:hypothetical protein TcWFU_008915 [Taenia crassiceps]|uniref:Uncharacterized protein n=1 Tax=Taenia crassiceps TaxID=6207 RepID=A0ABR4QJY9_9CEST